MRWLFLVLLLISLPAVVAYARKGTAHRDRLMLPLGALLFATGSISLDAALISWPVWPGTARGIVFSFVDCIAIALIATRKGRAPMPPFLGLCALLLLPMVLASFNAGTKMASVFSLIQFAQIVLLYFAIAPELAREGAIRALLKGIAVGLIVQAGYVVQQKLTGMVQAYGTAQHQNILGMMVQLAAVSLIAAAMEGVRSKLIYAGILAGAVCIAGGGSRASIGFFAAGIAMCLVVSLIRRGTPRKWKIIGIGVAAAAVLVPLTLGTLRDRFGDGEIVTGDESRLAFERAARAISADYPFGVGPNNFVTINNTGGYATKAGIEWGGGLLDKPVHNAYLLARSETGWAGQIALFLLVGGVAVAGFHTGFRSRHTGFVGIALGSACAVTTVALHSNYEYAWYLPEVQRLFFVNAALIAGCMTIAARETKEKTRRLRDRKPDASKAAIILAKSASGTPVEPANGKPN